MITLIFPYYDNPDMLIFQQKIWSDYPDSIRNRIRIIVIDDCSPSHPALLNIMGNRNYNLQLWKILTNVNWNWAAARNLGGKKSEDKSWLFMTDIDHVIPAESLIRLFKKIDNDRLDTNAFYTLNRVKAPDMVPVKIHPNSFFMHRSLFLKKFIGYDEEFALVYRGVYGMDGHYKRWFDSKASCIHLHKIYTQHYEGVIADASCNLPRKHGRDEEKLKAARDRGEEKLIHNINPIVFQFPNKRLI